MAYDEKHRKHGLRVFLLSLVIASDPKISMLCIKTSIIGYTEPELTQCTYSVGTTEGVYQVC